MQTLLRSTNAYRYFLRDGIAKTNLVLFPDAKYLRALLRECAAAFFCKGEEGRISHLVHEESFQDCLFLPAPDTRLTVEDAERIIDESLLKPMEGEKKLFVLDAFQTALAPVQNKLLKVLEEPPRGVSFLLGATAEYTLLPTVLSRAVKIAVPPFSEEEIARTLQRNGVSEEEAGAAAASSGGIYSEAEKFLSGGEELFRSAEEFFLGEGVALSRSLGERKEKREVLAALRLVLADALAMKTGRGKGVKRQTEGRKEIASRYPAGALIAALERVSEAEKQIQFNAPFAGCLLALAVGAEEDRIKWQKL